MGNTTNSKRKIFRPKADDTYDGRSPGQYLADMSPGTEKVISCRNLEDDQNEYHASKLSAIFWCAANAPPSEYKESSSTEHQRLLYLYHENVRCNEAFEGEEKELRFLRYHLSNLWVRSISYGSKENEHVEYHWFPGDIHALVIAVYDDLQTVQRRRQKDVQTWRKNGCNGNVGERPEEKEESN